MPLALYRRHLRGCKTGHAEELRTSEYDERKKGWKRCNCPIFCSGTLAKHFQRKNTAEWEWDSAKKILSRWESAGSWTGQATPPIASEPDPIPTLVPAGRTTIERATAAYAAEFEEYLASNTQRKYRFLLGKLKAFSEKRGYIMIEQWGP